MNRVETVPDRVKVKNVLVSTYDKSSLEQLTRSITAQEPNARFFATGGTHRYLAEVLKNPDSLVALEDHTGQPEMQGGLVKSLDFKIYLGILSEAYNSAHQDDLRRAAAVSFDLIVCNLYPFAEVVEDGADLEESRANIDIGGPTLIRAAAKNFHRVAVASSPTQYADIAAELERESGALSLHSRYGLARAAFDYIAAYDRAISDYLRTQREPSFEELYKIRRTGTST